MLVRRVRPADGRRPYNTNGGDLLTACRGYTKYGNQRSWGYLHQTHLSTVGVRGEDLIPGSYVRTRWRPTQSISRAHALCRGSGGEWNVDCHRGTAIPLFCF